MAFDASYYLTANNVAISALGLTPEAHYLRYGWEQGLAVSSTGGSLSSAN